MAILTFPDDTYFIPFEDKYIIYLPLKGIISLVNRKSAYQLSKVFNERLISSQSSHNSEMPASYQKGKEVFYRFNQTGESPAFIPRSVSLFLTNNCTLRCGYCYAKGGFEKTNMTWSTVTGVLDLVLSNVIASGQKDLTVHFHGGGDVSAAWQLLVRTRNYLNKIAAPYKVRIITSIGLNGMINSTQRDWIVRNIDSATISIDGPPFIQNRQRPQPDGSPSSYIVYDTLKAFDKARFVYGIRCTVTARSVKYLKRIASFICDNFAAKNIKIEPMFSRGRGADSAEFIPPNPVDFVDHFRKAFAIAAAAGRELIYSGARFPMITDVFCQAAGNSCAITPLGWITSCYEVLDKNDPLSKIFFYGRYDPVKRKFIINNRRRKRLFELSVQNRRLCEKCFCKWHCAGDCPAKALHKPGESVEDLPDRCYINRELTKDQLVRLINGNQDESIIKID